MVWIFNRPQRSHGAARLSSLSLPRFLPPLPIATSEVPPNATTVVTSQLGSHQAEELLAPCSSQFPWRAMEVLELQRKVTGSSSKAADHVQLAWTPLKVLMVFHGQANDSFQGLQPAPCSQGPVPSPDVALAVTFPGTARLPKQLNPSTVGAAFQGEQGAGDTGWRGQGPQ